MLKDIVSGFVSLFQADNQTDERRRVIRLRCRYSVYCVDERDVWTATVVDMGLQGMRIEQSDKVRPGTRLMLLYRSRAGGDGTTTLADIANNPDIAKRDGVACDVSWCKQDRYSKVVQVGLTYADTSARMGRSWVKTILREIGFDENTIFQRRKIIRVVSSIPCDIRRSDMTDRKVGRVVNMGAGGALLQLDSEIPANTSVILDIGPYEGYDHLKVGGTIVTSRWDTQTQSWLHGTRFRGMKSKQVELLGKYVVSLLKATMRKT